MGRLRIAALLLSGWLGVSPVCADIDTSEYELKSSIRSEKERQRMKTLLESEKKIEDERRRLEDTAEAKRLAEQKAAWDALPYAVRVTATRCTACHIEDNFTKQRHNRIGWELVVLRMQHLNDLKLDEGERSVIAAHLAQEYPVAGIDAAIETLMQVMGIFSPVGLWLAWHGARTGRWRMWTHRQDTDSTNAIPHQSAETKMDKNLYEKHDDANHSG